jgi:hypothetical protein
MLEKRSDSNILQSKVDIKSWQQQVPSVEAVRPAACPVCQAASRPEGKPLQIHGHGLRERQVLGPLSAHEAPEMVEITVRRYRCQPCGAVISVVPCQVVAKRLYSAAAIGFALALWGLLQWSARKVRQAVNPLRIVGATAIGSWASLRRWARAVSAGEIFRSLPRAVQRATHRDTAAQAAVMLAASACATSRELPVEQRAFVGAAQAV